MQPGPPVHRRPSLPRWRRSPRAAGTPGPTNPGRADAGGSPPRRRPGTARAAGPAGTGGRRWLIDPAPCAVAGPSRRDEPSRHPAADGDEISGHPCTGLVHVGEALPDLDDPEPRPRRHHRERDEALEQAPTDPRHHSGTGPAPRPYASARVLHRCHASLARIPIPRTDRGGSGPGRDRACTSVVRSDSEPIAYSASSLPEIVPRSRPTPQ